jgi:GR25 family glycosyltransferase involved in LPS biosynthesis
VIIRVVQLSRKLISFADFALILEDDAQFINDFWRRLEARLRSLPRFGVFYLQHSAQEAILRMNRKNLVIRNGRPVARKFDPLEVFGLGAGAFDGRLGTIWDAGGYLLSRGGIGTIMERTLPQWLRHARGTFKIYSSEMLLSYAADANGAYFSIPPLIYQCTSKASLIQSKGKADIDRLGRHKQKHMFNAILQQGREVAMPDWLLECGFDSHPHPANETGELSSVYILCVPL